MKLRTPLLFLLIIAVSMSCRKGEKLPKVSFFKLGTYTYDLTIDNKRFDQYHSLKFSLGQMEGSDRIFHRISQFRNYTIPYFDSTSNQNLIRNFNQFEYELLNAGLYASFHDTSGGMLNLRPDIRVLIVPNYDYKLDSLQGYYCSNLKEKVLQHKLEHNLNIDVNGTSYKVYKMYLAPGFNCNPNEQHILYVDQKIGIIRYEVRRLTNNNLIYQLDFNSFTPV